MWLLFWLLYTVSKCRIVTYLVLGVCCQFMFYPVTWKKKESTCFCRVNLFCTFQKPYFIYLIKYGLGSAWGFSLFLIRKITMGSVGGGEVNNIKAVLCNVKDLQLMENNLMCPIKPSILEFLQLFIFSCGFLVNKKRWKVWFSPWTLPEIAGTFSAVGPQGLMETLITPAVVVSSPACAVPCSSPRGARYWVNYLKVLSWL